MGRRELESMKTENELAMDTAAEKKKKSFSRGKLCEYQQSRKSFNSLTSPIYEHHFLAFL